MSVYIYIYTLAILKNEILPLERTSVDLEGIMLREINQTEKNKYCMILLIWETEKNKTNEQAKQIRNSCGYIEQKCSCQRAGGSGRKEIGDGDIRGIIFQFQINFK